MNGWIYSFLRRTQKYTGTDNVYLAEGGFWLVFNQIIGTAAAFISAIAFANLLDPAVYGNYKKLLSLIGMVSIFSLQGMRTAVAQAVARGLEGSFYSGFKTRLKWGSIGSLVSLGIAAYYWIQGNETLAMPLLISAIFLPLMNASRIYSGFLSGKKMFGIGAKYNIYTDIVSTGAIIAALFLTKNIFWLIAAYLISNTFLNCFFDILIKIKFKPNKNEDPQTLNYAKHLSLSGVISLMGEYLDKILLFTLAGPAQLAVYSFAALLPEQIKGLAGHVATLAFPKLAVKSGEEIKKSIPKKIWKLFLLGMLITVLYITAAPFIFKILFPQYSDSILYSQIYVISLIFLPDSLLGAVFTAKMMKKNIYLLKSFSLIRLILFIILIPLYGIWGLIFARIGMTALNFAFSLFLFKKI